MPERQNPIMTNVFLRIEHDSAEPQILTAALGVTPTTTARRGQLPIGGCVKPYAWNVWALSSGWAVQSQDVRAHFQWLLASIGPHASDLRSFREQGYRMEIHCLWIGRGGYGGPVLTP